MLIYFELDLYVILRFIRGSYKCTKMSLKEQIKNKDQDTKSYLINRISELELELKKTKDTLIALDRAMGDKHFETVNFFSSINREIPKDGTWLEKIIFIIKDRNRFLHNSEITQVLHLHDSENPKDYIKRRVSLVLSDAMINKKIDNLINYRFSNLKKDTVWGFEKWMDEEGEVKKEHMFFYYNQFHKKSTY